MIVRGRIYRLPEVMLDDVNTDIILRGEYLRLPEDQLAQHAFEGVIPGFPALVRERAVLLAGRNFGCGSSREQAPKALLGSGIRLVIAQSFGSIFFRNGLNLGLALLKVPARSVLDTLREDSIVEADVEQGILRVSSVQNQDSAREVVTQPLSRHLARILRAGGIMPLLRDDPGALDG